ncbi:MAG: ATP-binding cassette domain-containing protein [Candidatus Latescibacteria bacterium]|nr:ATP-binding cassette domain-containing protein [Candidatus Latescibacterota bacterium]
MNPEPIIQVKSLSRSYTRHRRASGLKGAIRSFFHRQFDTHEAVKNLSFDIVEGEFIGFIGPNGAGKTTTMKMLSGVLYPTSGQARVLGYTPQQRRSGFLKQISFVMGQKDTLFNDLPAMELFLLMRDMYEVSWRDFERALDMLSDLLDARDYLDVPVRQLSLGQRMKCELIAGLLHMPRVLFLDEPTIGLDVASQKTIRQFFRSYNAETGATILLTSHYLEDIKSLCERIIFIDHGVIRFDGSRRDIMERYATSVHISFMTGGEKKPDTVADLERLGAPKYDGATNTYRLHVKRPRAAAVARQLLNAYSVTSILIEEPSLEEIVTAMGEDRDR